MNASLAIALKDLRQLARDRGALFFTLAFPLLFAVFFGLIFSPRETSGIRIAVVDEDRSEGSQAFVRRLTEATELDVLQTTGDPPVDLTREQAEDLVRRGRRSACVVLPKGYGENDNLFDWSRQRSIGLGVDPSRSAEAGMLEGVLMRYAFEQFGQTISDPAKMRASMKKSMERVSNEPELGAPRKALLQGLFGSVDSLMADFQKEDASDAAAGKPGGSAGGFEPIKIERSSITVQRAGPPDAFSLTFAQSILWGIAGCVSVFAQGMAQERSRGTLLRLRAAPLGMAQILAGKALGCFLAVICVSALLLGVASTFFGVRPQSPALVALAIVCVAVCFVGIMMLFGTLTRSEAASASLSWAAILVLMMIGGAAVPLFAMPAWMQTASGVSPVKWAILAIEGGLWRGFTISELALPLVILLSVGVVCFSAGVASFKRSAGAPA